MINEQFKFTFYVSMVVAAAGWLLSIFGIIMLLFSFLTPFEIGLGFHVSEINVTLGFVLIGAGIILVLFSENIRVLLAIEQNTRKMSEATERRAQQRKARDFSLGRDPERGGEGLGSIVLKE
ncbi:MAG: hypothetical protein ACOX5R_12470 [bacterium]|jgi:hypothetical protein